MALMKMFRREHVLNKMFLFKLLCFIFIWSFDRLGISPAECKCRQKLFTQVKGCCYSTDVLSTHHVESLTHCAAGQLSLRLETCVGFKYRSTNDNLPNCERFKKMENCSECTATGSKNEGWKFYKAVPTTQTLLCSKNHSCKNGGTCVANPCDKENGFDCICKENFSGKFCQNVTGNFSSCKSLLQIGRDLPNGNYNIYENGTKATSMYCQMTSLEGCAGGGWTMVMKINGSKTTFDYSSAYWTDRTGYLNIHGRFGFDDVETKMPSYWSASFKEICIGMKVGNDLRFLTIPYAGESLRDLIAEDKFLATNVGREKWKSLIANSSLQSTCHKEGFNIYYLETKHVIARIGIVGDHQEDCGGPDSFLGLGGRYNMPSPLHCYPSEPSYPVSGNLATDICKADNGDVNVKSMGYILVR